MIISASENTFGPSETFSKTPRTRFVWLLTLIIFFHVCIGTLTLIFSSLPPTTFPHDVIFSVSSGESLSTIAKNLDEKKIIRSENLLQMIMKISGTSEDVHAGDYRFENPTHVFDVARRLATGDYGDVLVHVTIPEGSSLEDITTIAESKIRDFNADYFFEQALPYNGYLFPDTYYVAPTISEDDFLQLLRDEFSKKLQNIVSSELATLSPEKLREKVIMASILEREAKGKDDIYIISGILWKRIRINMPLQVDASFSFLLNKQSSELTREDLLLDSPYNTYKYTGLPPGPFGNPGALALEAAFYPAASPYLYYLHGNDGSVHFGKTFAEHTTNKKKYL